MKSLFISSILNWKGVNSILKHIVVVFCFLLFVFGIASHDVWTPDEPRELQMALEMIQNKSWIVPMLAKEPFVEKPPMYYWTSASALYLFSSIPNTAAIARGVSSLFSILTAILVYIVVKRITSKDTAVHSLLILTTFAGYWELAHWIRIDSVLAFWISTSVLLLIYGCLKDKPGIFFWAYPSAGIAFMTKGFVGWAIIFIPWAVSLILNRKQVVSRWIWHAAGLVIMATIPGIWAYAFYRVAGHDLFFEWFWVNQTGRFLGLTEQLGHIHGPLYYFGQLPLILMPWLPLFLFSLFWMLKRKWKELTENERFFLLPILAWSIGGFLLLSVAGTKRTIYLYPLLPGFAVLLAFAIKEAANWVRIFASSVNWMLATAGILISFVTPETFQLDNPSLTDILQSLSPHIGAIFFSAAGFLFLIALHRFPVHRSAGVAASFYLVVMLTCIPGFDAFKNNRGFITGFVSSIPESIRTHCCGWNLDQTTRALVPYYCNWTIPIVEDPQLLEQILDGRNPDFTYVIIQKEKKFPPQNLSQIQYQQIFTSQSMTRRALILIAPNHSSEESIVQ